MVYSWPLEDPLLAHVACLTSGPGIAGGRYNDLVIDRALGGVLLYRWLEGWLPFSLHQLRGMNGLISFYLAHNRVSVLMENYYCN